MQIHDCCYVQQAVTASSDWYQSSSTIKLVFQSEFGKSSVVKRSFQQQWFQRRPWLHHNEDCDLAFCFPCVVAYENNHLRSTPFLEQSLISTGFSYWKDGVT